MRRFFAKNTTTSTKGNITVINLHYNNQRSFATGPQKNPYSSVLRSLSVGNQNYSFYNLPALQDKRIRKLKNLIRFRPILNPLFYREASLFNPCPPRISRP